MWFLLHYTGSPWIAELIYQQRFSDGTWGNKIRPSIIENDSNIRLESMAVAPNGTLHVTWQGFASSDSSSTFHAMHAVNGLWSEPILVHQREANTTENLPTSHISVDSQGNVHAVFTMIPQEDLNAYYRLWRPGSGWQPEVSLENETWYNAAPITTIDPYGIVHLMVPKENEGSIYFRSLPATTSSIASLSQQVTIPVNMPAPTLSFMAQRPGDVPDDASSFELLVSGGVTTTAVPLVSGASDWSHYWVDMSPWAGQTVTINFQLTQTSGDPRVQAAIDDVTLGSAYPDAWVSGNGPGVALPGETVIYHIEYGNHGRIATANGEVMAAWPEYLTFVSANITPTLGADTLTWSFEELGTEYGPVKLVLTATVDASAPFGENINLPISIHSATSEVELINNQIVIPLLIVHQTFLPVLFKP
jgi:hypothetical protein